MTVFVAAGAVSIVPDEPLPLAGYMDRPEPFGSVSSPIEASIVIFGTNDDRVALIGLDTLFASAALEEAIRRHLTNPSISLILVATHTHFAPSLDDRKPALGVAAAAYIGQVGRSVADAINRLDQELTPGTCHYAYDRVPGAIYRRRFQPMASRHFPFVRFGTAMAPNTRAETQNIMQVAVLGNIAQPRAVIWTWPCHAVASPDRLSLSADFPGEVRAQLRHHFGNPSLPIIYLPGFCGDIRPDMRGGRWSVRNLLYNLLLPLPSFASMSRDIYTGFCNDLSERLITAIAHGAPTKVDGAISLDKADFPIGAFLAPQQDAEIAIQSLTVGALSFLFVGAEVCSPYYKLLDFEPNDRRFLTGCAGSVFGYLPTARQVKFGGYEVNGFLNAFGIGGKFSKSFEEPFLATIKQVMK